MKPIIDRFLPENNMLAAYLFEELGTIFDFLLSAVQTEYDQVRLLKQSERSEISLIRHKATGTRYIFRRFTGCGDVYRQLLHIDCPHLPNIIEVAEKDEQILVLEEYIHGDTMDFLLEAGTLSPAQARAIIPQLCNALRVLHCLGAVHRDIKPENVILQSDRAVLIDFDASRLFKPENRGDTIVLGTTGYAAPEQYGISQTSPQTDIYALGVLLNVMLTGKHPSLQLAPGRMGRVIQRCTMTNPKKRYKSVLHLMEAL